MFAKSPDHIPRSAFGEPRSADRRKYKSPLSKCHRGTPHAVFQRMGFSAQAFNRSRSTGLPVAVGLTKPLRDGLPIDGAHHPKSAGLIAVQPQASGPIDPNSSATALHEPIRLERTPLGIQSPCRKQPQNRLFIEPLLKVTRDNQKIHPMGGVRHAVVYPVRSA